MSRGRWASAEAWLLAALLPAATAFGMSARATTRPLAAVSIVPQSRAFSLRTQPGGPSAPSVVVTGVTVDVAILEQAATTTMDIGLQNKTGSREQAELLVPVPDGAVLRGFTFEGAASAPTAEVLPRDEARRTYNSIVAQVRDPALLEFAGSGLVRSSVFPVEPGSIQRVRLVYEQVLASDGHRSDYVLPRSETLDGQAPWQVSLRIQSRRPVATVFSPTHRLEVTRAGAGSVSARAPADSMAAPGPFCLAYLQGGEGVAGTLLAYPDPRVGGGYFLLLAALPARDAEPRNGGFVRRRVLPALERLAGSADDAGQAGQGTRRPALASPELRVLGADGEPATRRVCNLLPEKLPDLSEGDQLLLVGQYVGKGPLTLEVRGSSLGRERGFRFRLDPSQAATRNAFVPRLWASRRIDALLAAIGPQGAAAAPASGTSPAPSDPGRQALIRQVVELSTQFGILTEHTAFLAREGTPLPPQGVARRSAGISTVLGQTPVDLVAARRAGPALLAASPRSHPASDTMRQVSDRTFYRRGGRWVDSLLLSRGDKAQPDRVVALGTREFFALAERLAGEGRQGILALPGDTLLSLDGQVVLMRLGTDSRAANPAAL